MIKKLVCLLAICSALVITMTPSSTTYAYADNSEIMTLQAGHGSGAET